MDMQFICWLEVSHDMSMKQFHKLDDEQKAEMIAEYSNDMIMEMTD